MIPCRACMCPPPRLPRCPRPPAATLPSATGGWPTSPRARTGTPSRSSPRSSTPSAATCPRASYPTTISSFRKGVGFGLGNFALNQPNSDTYKAVKESSLWLWERSFLIFRQLPTLGRQEKTRKMNSCVNTLLSLPSLLCKSFSSKYLALSDWWEVYRAPLIGGPQVAWMLQASWGRSGKQGQEQTSRNYVQAF